MRLITMPHSHYCEKARWALDLSGIPYVEEVHAPLFHMTATKPKGGRSVPVLMHEGRAYLDSTDILLLLDKLGAPLYPADPAMRAEVIALEDDFDEDLGPHARRWGYAQLLPHTRMLRTIVSPGAPAFERTALPVIMPAFKSLVRKAFRITPESAQRSLERCRAAFGRVDARLADGRRFLVPDRLTAADITFASLGALLVFPPQYRGAMPDLDVAPAAMREEVRRMRETVAGKFILRLFAEHRGPQKERSPR